MSSSGDENERGDLQAKTVVKQTVTSVYYKQQITEKVAHFFFSLSFHFPCWLFLLPLFFSSLCAFPPFLQFPVTVQNSQNNKLKKGRPTVFEKREEQSQDRYQHHDTMHSNTVINLPLFLMTN